MISSLWKLLLGFASVCTLFLKLYSLFFPNATTYTNSLIVILILLVFIYFLLRLRRTHYEYRNWLNADPIVSFSRGELFTTNVLTPAMTKLTDECVRRAFGRSPVSYKKYELWRKHNTYLLTCVLDSFGELVGFFDVFPLKKTAGDNLINGLLAERDITINDVVPQDALEDAECIHIATLYCYTRNDRERFLYPFLVMTLLFDFIMKLYPPRQGRIYSAYAITAEGRTALQRNNFSLMLTKKQTREKNDLYISYKGISNDGSISSINLGYAYRF